MILTLPLLLSVLWTAQDATLFRSGVTLVRVDAEVVDQDGRVLTGFEKEDFAVFDESREQPIHHFASANVPLDLVLLFDISGSMRSAVEKVAAAAQQGLRELRRGDRVSVAVFNHEHRIMLPLTNDLDAVNQSIQDVLNLEFEGGTSINRAVDETALKFMGEPRTESRRAVLIVTDNFGGGNPSEKTVVRHFWEADAVLSGLLIDPFTKGMRTAVLIMNPAMYLLLPKGINGIAEKTGGDAITSDDPGAAFQESMRRLRSRYSLYYAPPDGKPGKVRNITVKLSGGGAVKFPKARVRARRGYVAPAAKEVALTQ